MRSVNESLPPRNGYFILDAIGVSGVQQFLYFDGKTLTPVLKVGDAVGGIRVI